MNVKFPPCLGVTVGDVVVVGVVTAEVVVAGFDVVVDDGDPQLMIDEAQINRIVIMMSSFFIAFPPFFICP